MKTISWLNKEITHAIAKQNANICLYYFTFVLLINVSGVFMLDTCPQPEEEHWITFFKMNDLFSFFSLLIVI